MSNVLAAAVIGVMSGLHAACWGMYKDAPHEGFSPLTYSRSAVLGLTIGAALGLIVPVDAASASGAAILFGVIYAIERALAELYKTFFRQQDQSKYAIPMQLAVLGVPVEDRLTRALFGTAYLGVMLGLVALVFRFQHSGAAPADIPARALVASAGAWISAFGGAWKDAPVEGFQTFKFFRSPLLAFAWALLLGQLTPDLVLLTLAATGYTIATTETYKTFFWPSRPRGKFAGKPVHFPAMLRTRQRVVPLYVAICLGVIVAIAAGLRNPVLPVRAQAEEVAHG
jgi:membrane associated rhomboid family serine protease